MTLLSDARAALAEAYPDLCEPTVVLTEEMGRQKMWLVKRECRHPQEFEQRRRAVGFLTEWCAKHAPEVVVYVDGRMPPGWLEAMLELEERLGEFPPGGAGGGYRPMVRRRAEERLKRDEIMRWADDGGLDVDERERAEWLWLLRMAEQEDRLGPLLPNGFGGGVAPIARARREERLHRDEVMRWEDEGGRQ